MADTFADLLREVGISDEPRDTRSQAMQAALPRTLPNGPGGRAPYRQPARRVPNMPRRMQPNSNRNELPSPYGGADEADRVARTAAVQTPEMRAQTEQSYRNVPLQFAAEATTMPGWYRTGNALGNERYGDAAVEGGLSALGLLTMGAGPEIAGGARTGRGLFGAKPPRVPQIVEPPPAPIRPPPRQIGANGLPVRPPEPFRNSMRGGSEDLRDAAAMRSDAPDAGGGARRQFAFGDGERLTYGRTGDNFASTTGRNGWGKEIDLTPDVRAIDLSAPDTRALRLAAKKLRNSGFEAVLQHYPGQEGLEGVWGVALRETNTGRIVGGVDLYPYREGAVSSRGAFIEPEYRGRGLGQAAYAVAADIADANGLRVLSDPKSTSASATQVWERLNRQGVARRTRGLDSAFETVPEKGYAQRSAAARPDAGSAARVQRVRVADLKFPAQGEQRRLQGPYRNDGPLLVGRNADGSLEVFDGNHRARLAQSEGVQEVDAVVMPSDEIRRIYTEGNRPGGPIGAEALREVTSQHAPAVGPRAEGPQMPGGGGPDAPPRGPAPRSRTPFYDAFGGGRQLNSVVGGVPLPGKPRGRAPQRGADSFSHPGLTEAQRKAAEMARNNFSNAEIAEELDISEAAVRKRLADARARGAEIPFSQSPGPEGHGEWTSAQLYDMRAEGLSPTTIAERTGVPYGSVRARISREASRRNAAPPPSEPIASSVGGVPIPGVVRRDIRNGARLIRNVARLASDGSGAALRALPRGFGGRMTAMGDAAKLPFDQGPRFVGQLPRRANNAPVDPRAVWAGAGLLSIPTGAATAGLVTQNAAESAATERMAALNAQNRERLDSALRAKWPVYQNPGKPAWEDRRLYVMPGGELDQPNPGYAINPATGRPLPAPKFRRNKNAPARTGAFR